MNIQNLDYFLTIVETGNLTKAAEKLFVSQPSLSQYLKRLEKNLGVELFDLSILPMRLTYSGERYYQYAIQAKKLDENIRRELADIESSQSGLLRLGVALWRGAVLLPDIYPSFHSKYPGIRIELFEGRSNQLQNALLNDNIDLAVMNLPRSINYKNLSYEIFHEEKILLAAPAHHPAIQASLKEPSSNIGKRPRISLEILEHIPLIMLKPGQNLTYEVNRILELNHAKYDVLMDTGNLTTAINLVSQQVACTFVPEEGANICLHPDTVIYFEIESTIECVWDLAVVYRKDSYLNQICRLFISELKNINF